MCSSWKFSAAVPHSGGLGLRREGQWVPSMSLFVCVSPKRGSVTRGALLQIWLLWGFALLGL